MLKVTQQDMEELGSELRQFDFRDCASISVHMLHLLNQTLKNSHNIIRQNILFTTAIKKSSFSFILNQCSLMFLGSDLFTHTVVYTQLQILIKTNHCSQIVYFLIGYKKRNPKETWPRNIIQDIRNVMSKQPPVCGARYWTT